MDTTDMLRSELGRTELGRSELGRTDMIRTELVGTELTEPTGPNSMATTPPPSTTKPSLPILPTRHKSSIVSFTTTLPHSLSPESFRILTAFSQGQALSTMEQENVGNFTYSLAILVINLY